jgi:hypothetical protein
MCCTQRNALLPLEASLQGRENDVSIPVVYRTQLACSWQLL